MNETYVLDFKAQVKKYNCSKEFEDSILDALKDQDCYVEIAPYEVFEWLKLRVFPKNNLCTQNGWEIIKMDLGYKIPVYTVCGK